MQPNWHYMMNISILQHDILWASTAENLSRLDKLVDRQPQADVYVLTEMFTTGFATSNADEVSKDSQLAVEWLKRKARERNAAFAASIAVEDSGKFYNRLFFVKPDGDITIYNKRHLFAYGGEDKMFTAGEERAVVDFRGVRFLLLVCFDLRFPVWSRYHDDYDAIIYVANWPTCRIDSWDVLLRARAIENQCFVIGVNRVGSDPSNDYCGNSVVINPYGQSIAACTPDEECGAIAELNLDEMRSYREKFPIHTDFSPTFPRITQKEPKPLC